MCGCHGNVGTHKHALNIGVCSFAENLDLTFFFFFFIICTQQYNNYYYSCSMVKSENSLYNRAGTFPRKSAARMIFFDVSCLRFDKTINCSQGMTSSL